jgi:hypothetical protein
MKLYNLYEEVILEEVEFKTDKQLVIKIVEEFLNKLKQINEGVSVSQVIDAINNKYNVNILYRDYADLSIPPSKRYIQVYLYGKTKNKNGGNDAIRAYQIFGGSKHDEKNGWRVFRLDKIEGWFPTKIKFSSNIDTKDSSIPKFKSDDKKMSTVYDYVEGSNQSNEKVTNKQTNK